MRRHSLIVLAAVLAAGSPVSAQVLPGNVGPPRLPGVGGAVTGVTDGLGDAARLDDLRDRVVDRALQAPARLSGMVRRSDGALQTDPNGWPVVAGEIVVVGMDDASRRAATQAGFAVLREEPLAALGLTALVLAPPSRTPLTRAVERLRRLAPGAAIDFNHVYVPAGEVSGGVRLAPSPAAAHAAPPPRRPLGLIDTGVEATHPALAGSDIVQRGFAGPPRMGAHGTAVASLMVGRFAGFAGGAPGASLRVADIYGGRADGGSSVALAQALAWMVDAGVGVVNVSLVGPRNPLVERAVSAAEQRGLILVAAVGNDGPAAPPLFPASYPGVIGVTAVSAADRVLPEAGRGPQVSVAAPGADMAAAGPAGGWTGVRGTSFAAPIVAGLIAESGGSAQVLRSARDLGAPGPDPVYGAGMVGADRRSAPASVGARGRLEH